MKFPSSLDIKKGAQQQIMDSSPGYTISPCLCPPLEDVAEGNALTIDN